MKEKCSWNIMNGIFCSTLSTRDKRERMFNNWVARLGWSFCTVKCTIKVRFILHFIRYRNNWFNKTERSPDAEDELIFDVDDLLFLLSDWVQQSRC